MDNEIKALITSFVLLIVVGGLILFFSQRAKNKARKNPKD